MRLRLFDWGPSPFCLKVRAILDHKGVPYERTNVLGRPLFELRKRGKVGKVPALDIDGRLVVDSTDIAHELERLFPDPPILPRDPHLRATCHVIEDWADESLYWIGIYYQWAEPEGAAQVPRAFGKGPVGRIAYRMFARRIARQLDGQGIGRKPAPAVRDDLERHLDAADALVSGRDFLLGDAPMLCDFALAAQLVYLRRTPVGGQAMSGRPVIAYADRMKELRHAKAA